MDMNKKFFTINKTLLIPAVLIELIAVFLITIPICSKYIFELMKSFELSDFYIAISYKQIIISMIIGTLLLILGKIIHYNKVEISYEQKYRTFYITFTNRIKSKSQQVEINIDEMRCMHDNNILFIKSFTDKEVMTFYLKEDKGINAKYISAFINDIIQFNHSY